MNWKTVAKDYLLFTKRDRLAAFVILGAIVLTYLATVFSRRQNDAVILREDSTISRSLDTLEQKQASKSKRFYDENEDSRHYTYEPSKNNSYTKGELFTFDPNTLSLDGWKRLGLNDRTVKTIDNYRTKGGKFYKPEDVQKIWGLPHGFYERVEDYIHITSIEKDRFDKDPSSRFEKPYERKERRIAEVNINEGDTAAFVALPGIGSKLAYRITNFRDKLGGFYSVEQIGETYGLPDSTFQKIKPYLKADAASVRKININTATKEELKTHPYIRWNLANAIVEYRNQHGGRFSSVADLKNILLIDEATFAKIAPYLTL